MRSDRTAPGADAVELAFTVARPLGDVYRFFADPANLDRVTPGWFRLAFVDAPPGAIEDGTFIDYRLRYRGLPLAWRSLIVVWRPPARFDYVQVCGPFATFRHQHDFRTVPGGTEVRDRIVFRAPWHPLTRRVVAADLERILAYRRRASLAWLDGEGSRLASPARRAEAAG